MSNVRQFDENEKRSESLLDVLDEVGIHPSNFVTFIDSVQALRDWEHLPRDDMMQWSRDLVEPSISKETTIV